MICGYEIHPAANEFPMIDKESFASLKESIASNGQREAIKLCDGKIIDGRNRALACEQLGIKPRTEAFAGDPWALVWDLNGERRHLESKEQKYLIWKHCHEQSEAWKAKQQTIRDEANAKRSAAAVMRERTDDGTFSSSNTTCVTTGFHNRNLAQQAKAEASKTNRGAVQRGDELAQKRPDLEEQVRKGAIPAARAYKEMKKEERKEQIKQAVWPANKYRVIYADPPWDYSNAGLQHSAAQQYETMPIDKLKLLPVSNLALPDSILFMWATSPLLDEAIDLIRAWGFKYKSNFVWDKERPVFGHYNQMRHEILLIATMGTVHPDTESRYPSVITLKREERHSAKPDYFRNMIADLYPHGPRIELFARNKSDGWEVFGNEL